MKRTYLVDFETGAIRDRPAYPPEPVGVAIAELTPRGKVVKPRYIAWGHPTKNNATRGDALKALEEIWDSDADVCFHNAKFDLDVAATHLGLALPPWQRVHDTLFLIYLDDPRATLLSLKPSAARILGLPPDEQEAVRDWLVANGVCRKGAKDWGAAIALAPGDVVGRYAIGDVERTGLLLHKLLPAIAKRGMRAAYDRERALLPTLLANETKGIRVDLEALRADVRDYGKALLKTDAWIIKQLGASKDLNVDSDAALATALEHAGVIESATATKTGKLSTSYKTLRLTDPRLQDALFYREKLANALRTFMVPWLSTAERSGGWIYTNWNQVRGTNDKGTRTGRFSSNPNFQNIPNEYKPFKFPVRVPPLPLVRKYILPDADDHVIVSADYSQQELRALGHFEDGPLLRAYLDNPRMDIHDHARDLINGMLGTNLSRKPIKNMGFGLVYGMGIDLLASMMGVDADMARRIKTAYLTIFPGLRSLSDDLTRRAKLGLPIKTWGGREYYCEEPRMVDGRLRTFEYKLLNVLIQGSSADCTKEAMVRYAAVAKCGRFMIQVHDQLMISVPRAHATSEARLLRDAMESVEFDVKMLVDLSIGPSWDKLEPLEA